MSRVHATDYSSLLVYLFSEKAIPLGDCVMGKDKKSRNVSSAWQLLLSTVLFRFFKKKNRSEKRMNLIDSTRLQ